MVRASISISFRPSNNILEYTWNRLFSAVSPSPPTKGLCPIQSDRHYYQLVIVFMSETVIRSRITTDFLINLAKCVRNDGKLTFYLAYLSTNTLQEVEIDSRVWEMNSRHFEFRTYFQVGLPIQYLHRSSNFFATLEERGFSSYFWIMAFSRSKHD